MIFRQSLQVISLFCRTLLNHGADINGKNILGWCPLHVAATLRRPDVMGIFLEHPNIDVDVTDLVSNVVSRAQCYNQYIFALMV